MTGPKWIPSDKGREPIIPIPPREKFISVHRTQKRDTIASVKIVQSQVIVPKEQEIPHITLEELDAEKKLIDAKLNAVNKFTRG